MRFRREFNPLSANPIKWSNTLKHFVDKLPTNCLSVLDHFVRLPLKGLKSSKNSKSLGKYSGYLSFWKSFITPRWFGFTYGILVSSGKSKSTIKIQDTFTWCSTKELHCLFPKASKTSKKWILLVKCHSSTGVFQTFC